MTRAGVQPGCACEAYAPSANTPANDEPPYATVQRCARLLTLLVAGLCPLAICAASEETQRGAPQTPDAWHWVAVYKADLLQTNAPRLTTGVGNLGLRIDVDAAALLGWDDTAMHTELLWNHGGKPNRRIATVQGISNLEVAQNAARIYASWIEHDFKTSGTRMLFGLYDLNSEFYANDASALLIHPSFGIGIDFSQSGRNGPSIFPNLGLSLRIHQALGKGFYIQGAVTDGVPGDPDHPGHTAIRLSRDDGALLVAEFGWQQGGADGPKPGHWGVGAWHYTGRSERVDSGAPQHNYGVYAIAQMVLLDRGSGRTTGFVRAGAANRRVNAIDLAFDAGVLVDQPLGERGPVAFTAGVAVARFGRAHRAAKAALGVTGAATETALEVGARWEPLPNLALQPLLQRVWHPGGRSGAAATIAGLRVEWTFGPSKP